MPVPFGQENMTLDRKTTALDAVIGDANTAVAEAVRHIFFTGSPERRNVRINNSYATAEYWDGHRWWTRSLHEIVREMSDFAVGEIEHCLDWSERLSDRTKTIMEDHIVRYRTDDVVKERTMDQVIEVMIKPYEGKILQPLDAGERPQPFRV